MTDQEHIQCRELLGSLSDYIDGTLGEQLCREIERHMSECHNCRVVVDTLRKTIHLYHQTAGPADLPNSVRERLFRTLHLDEFIR